MKRKALKLALVCLHVISFDTFAANSIDIDSIVSESQESAQVQIQKKVRDNAALLEEIQQLEEQIKALQENVAINNKDIKRDLYIAGGTIIATVLARIYFNRSVKNETADQFRILLGIASTYIGSAITVVSSGASGVNYVLVHIDQNKISLFQEKLEKLKEKIQSENQALSQ